MASDEHNGAPADLKAAYKDLKGRYDTKSEFVSLMVHQLRTPLSALKWSIKMLLDGDLGELSPEQRNVLAKGYNSNDRMIQLVNDILNVERIEAGEFQYEFQAIDIKTLLGELVAELSHTAEENNVRIELADAGELPPVRADREKLRVVFQNLIDNAIKYSTSGGAITLSARVDGDMLTTSVADTGIGIPESEQDRVFSKFFRSSSAVKVKTEGSGLGLFIARVIVEGHGGRITFTSETGKGTTFDVTLPLYKTA